MIGINNRPIKTAGGLKIIPDCTVSEIDISADTVLLLAGANTWHDKKHKDILSLTEKVLLENGTVVSMCASVGALNSLGILATRALLVAYTLVTKFNIIDPDILDAWYHYYKMSDLQYYYRLQALFSKKFSNTVIIV